MENPMAYHKPTNLATGAVPQQIPPAMGNPTTYYGTANFAAGAVPQQMPTAYVKPKNAFKPDISDFVFALAAFVLGYLFSSWILFTNSGWGVSAFTTLYLLAVTAYLMKKGVFVSSGAAAWFWFAVTWVTGVSYALWQNESTSQYRLMFLFCTAVYYVIVASGREIMGKTGNYLLIDGINAVIILPFRNFLNQYVSFGALGKGSKRTGKTLSIVIGVVIAVILAALLTPLLRSADSGGFGKILDFFAEMFTIKFETLFKIIVYIVFAVPVAAYLYGLVSGAAHRKGTDIIKPDSVKKTVAELRFFQPTTLFIALGAVCALYIVFIISQLPYFFSAFTGQRPAGWLIYSTYARQGFFELCGIAAINLIIISVSNLTCKKHRKDSRLLKAFNIVLAIITLVLITTAFSKMALYIGAYGLTMPRLLPCVFMAFIATVFIALLALQKWDFSIVRVALVIGSVMLCALFISNPDALVVRYNTGRYLSGSLQEYDPDILYRAGSAGVLPAIEVYSKTSDARIREKVAQYLELQSDYLKRDSWWLGRGVNEISLESQRARKAITAHNLFRAENSYPSYAKFNFVPE
ncbi:MAG: DUF4173 domain-containing protein [Oscillospiraceae bacterium]|nr:DUF4173 domain-containing protein [Oscillospiraceae bacterium]